jgi:hypothetical protein
MGLWSIKLFMNDFIIMVIPKMNQLIDANRHQWIYGLFFPTNKLVGYFRTSLRDVAVAARHNAGCSVGQIANLPYKRSNKNRNQLILYLIKIVNKV